MVHRRQLAVLLPAVAFAMAMSGCGERPAPPPPPPPPVQSAWTPADSQDVAKQMIDAAARDQWVSEFTGKAGHPPHILIGDIVDRSNDSVDMKELSNDLQAAITASGTLVLANGRDDCDATLAGGIDRQAVGDSAYEYALDLHLTGTAHGDPVWVRSVERRKTITPSP